MRYAIFKTPLGWCGALEGGRGLKRLTLPQPSAAAARAALAPPPGAQEDAIRLADIISNLRHYLQGEAVVFNVSLDLTAGTPFQRRVWRAARGIPHGETRSYGWLAAAAGNPGAARAAGQAMARNPLPPIVPCHRVVARHGIGGFSGGLEMKRRLLALETTS